MALKSRFLRKHLRHLHIVLSFHTVPLDAVPVFSLFLFSIYVIVEFLSIFGVAKRIIAFLPERNT
ncbi:hypothetical protein K438DRAFT_1985038 [Mycena galopus ATCC 62051]|nr:hypothetical protein K438DRAFT_1985038 [Mycena galopus ATCC 62051]